MKSCDFVKELDRLRKSSGDSIDSEKSFNSFKQYMHVQRDVEDDLKGILKSVNESDRKTLVLLCGSAGDGKSHMLSYLKNFDEDHLLDGYRIHNDATESSAPNKTAIDTLNEVLGDFTDEKIEKPGKNLILAINLGVLNNFIESDYGKRFNILRKYVEGHNILSTKMVDYKEERNSPIQHISFSDYQLFALNESGVDSKYIKSLLDRIYNSNIENPFNKVFIKCEQCSLYQMCPVRYNFIFLQNKKVQDYISKLLIYTILNKKEILTTREILNYFYDITVPQNLENLDLSFVTINNNKNLKRFFLGITPSLIFDQTGVSPLMDNVRESDPVLFRDESSDDFAIEYHVSGDVTKTITEILGNLPYGEFLLKSGYLNEINSDKEIRGIMFSCLIRLKAMVGKDIQNETYNEFIKDLFYFNSGKKKKLSNLYEQVKNAVFQWCGKDDDHIRLNQKGNKYTLFESIKFTPNLACMAKSSDVKELHRFIPELKVSYKDDKGNSITLDIDFPLYQMIHKLNNGYIHTIDDVNNFADFISFKDRMLRIGNAIQEVFIIGSDGKKSVLQKNDFGYKFEVKK